MIEDVLEVIEEGVEEVTFSGTVGVLFEFSDGDVAKIFSDISTVTTAADLAQGEVSIATMLSLLKDKR